MRIPIFSGKGAVLAVCFGKIFPTKPRFFYFFLPISREMHGVFVTKLPEQLRRGGGE